MKYDAVSKRLMQLGARHILSRLLGLDIASHEDVSAEPTETVRVGRSDYVQMVTLADGSRRVLVVEFQTEWRPEVPVRLLEYKAHHWRKHKLPVDTALFLYRPTTSAVATLRDHELIYTYRLVKFWELNATEFLTADAHVLPYVPLMRDGLRHVRAVEERLYSDPKLPNPEKIDLLTILDIYTGMHDPGLARELLRRRRELMRESPIYQDILQEGEARGKREGKDEGRLEQALETARNMVREGLAVDLILRVTGLSLQQLREGGIVA